MQTPSQLSENIPLQLPFGSSSTLVWTGQSNGPPSPLHPEIHSIVQLTNTHKHKVYFSGPLVCRLERQPNGQPSDEVEGWKKVWAQLAGTTLRLWGMKEFQEAEAQGKQVTPSYVNVADTFVQVFDKITVATTSSTPAKRYTNLLALNTVGSNLLLFLCPSTESLTSWASALRLSAWERSRMEEIYTAHLIRTSNITHDAPTTLMHGQLKGWVRIRVAGQTDWMRVWMVVSSCADSAAQLDKVGDGIASTSTRTATLKKRRMLPRETNFTHLPTKPIVGVYLSNRPKDMKKPLLTITEITQAFSVYPGRPDLINESALIKLEGTLGDEELAGGMRSRETWVFVVPGDIGQTPEMLKWVVSFHDAFCLYGRPKSWTWDSSDPVSLMFANPVGLLQDSLFLDRELAEALDPKDDRTSAIRSRLVDIVLNRMRGNNIHPSPQASFNCSEGLVSSIADTPASPPPCAGRETLSLDSTALTTPTTAESHFKLSAVSRLTERAEPAPPIIPLASNIVNLEQSINRHIYASSETNEWKSQGEDVWGNSRKAMSGEELRTWRPPEIKEPRRGKNRQRSLKLTGAEQQGEQKEFRSGELETSLTLLPVAENGSRKRQDGLVHSGIFKEMEERSGHGPLLYLLKIYGETQGTPK